MSTASNAIKTALFTLFVPLVVARVGPAEDAGHRRRRARCLGASRAVCFSCWERLVTSGVRGYFVRAQGTPAPIFAHEKNRHRAACIGSIATPCTPRCWRLCSGRRVLQSRRLAEYGLFLFVCFHLFVVFYEEPDFTGSALMANMKSFAEECRGGSRISTTDLGATSFPFFWERVERLLLESSAACLSSWLPLRHVAQNYCATPASPLPSNPHTSPSSPCRTNSRSHYAKRLASDKARAIFAESP